MRQINYYEAYLDDYHKIIVYMSKLSYEGVSNRFYLRDDVGNIMELSIQSIETTPNNYNKYTLKLRTDIVMGNEYEVVHQHARATILKYSAIVKTARFDESYFYDGNDLGYLYEHHKTQFALWAPTAFRVKLEVLKNGIIKTYEMKRCEKGIFRFIVSEDLENATYIYHVRVNGSWNESIDPYGIASIENTKRSAIIDPHKIHSKDFRLKKMKSACDAIIYEASIRDFTMQKDCGVSQRGKFRGFIEENEQTIEKNTGFTYLKSLGITHVQLMPVLDFGSVDEIHPKLYYNWGYDPVQYRTLEGSFSMDPFHPYDRIFEFVGLVEQCHKAGIRVNLDVVFNHVYDKESSSFEKVVPNYYFQMNEHGDFSNGTFCGNDMDSKRKMCSKFIVDTCVFLTKTYRIDGMRFDLMGILDVDTMNDVVRACRTINPDFMVYGEGWNMPSFLDSDERASIDNQARMPYVGHFSDRFRDVVKGRTATNEASVKGYCSGDTYLLDIMKNVLSASCTYEGMEPMFSHPRNAVNYIECHDNMTSWDKLKECCKELNREERTEIQKMLNATCLLAQGIPFLHCGQEFSRTKHGKPNTYEDSDEINQIDYNRRNQFQSVVSCTKDLIALRKSYSCLRYATKEEVEKHVHFEDIDHQVLIYRMQDAQHDMVVFFNPTKQKYFYNLKTAYTLLYSNAKTEDIRMDKVDIDPFSVTILHRSINK